MPRMRYSKRLLSDDLSTVRQAASEINAGLPVSQASDAGASKVEPAKITRTSDNQRRKPAKSARARPVKKKQSSLPALRAKAWAAFSRYIRYGVAGEWELVLCVSCGNPYRPAEMHAGHFIHCSKQSPLSYDERNIHPQCRQCNYYGMQGLAAIRYTVYMQQTYGPGIVDELMAMKHDKRYLKRAELEAIVERYR